VIFKTIKEDFWRVASGEQLLDSDFWIVAWWHWHSCKQKKKGKSCIAQSSGRKNNKNKMSNWEGKIKTINQ